MSAARFARLLVVPDGPGRSDNRLTCGGSGGGALDGGQTCGNDGPPAPCREDFAHLGDGQERAYRQARNKWAAAGKKRKRHESKHAERDAKVHHDAARAQIMRLRCGETQDAAESLAAYRAAGHSTDRTEASGVRPADTNCGTAKAKAAAEVSANFEVIRMIGFQGLRISSG